MTLPEPNGCEQRYTPADEAAVEVLKLRILTAFTYPHGHPGIPGIPDGAGCPRCNAEHALDAVVRRVAS